MSGSELKFLLQLCYSGGVLDVVVKEAHQLFGKRSQDPYALVYLLDKEKNNGERHAKTWFQENNKRTAVVEKSLDPEWNRSFKFEGVSDIENKSLVIAIWDRDSTSKDDYMAGVRIPMEEVRFFDPNKGFVSLDLQAQLDDGHVSHTSNFNSFLHLHYMY